MFEQPNEQAFNILLKKTKKNQGSNDVSYNFILAWYHIR